MSRRAGSVRVVPVTIALALALSSGVARAQFTPTGLAERTSNPELDVRRIRSGLVLSLSIGYGIGQVSGYPSNANQIGNPAYYSSSNVLLGSGAGLFLGYAVADYLNFGFFFAGRGLKSGDWTASMGGLGVRAEAFPLVSAVPKLKDLGLFGAFGIGSSTLTAVAPDYPEAKGVSSFIGIGAMYEWKIFRLFGGHGVAGPSVEYDTVFSQSITAGAVVVGGRIAYYGGM